jgi:hypothetical protein
MLTALHCRMESVPARPAGKLDMKQYRGAFFANTALRCVFVAFTWCVGVLIIRYRRAAAGPAREVVSVRMEGLRFNAWIVKVQSNAAMAVINIAARHAGVHSKQPANQRGHDMLAPRPYAQRMGSSTVLSASFQHAAFPQRACVCSSRRRQRADTIMQNLVCKSITCAGGTSTLCSLCKSFR